MSSCNGNGSSVSTSLAMDPAKRVKYNLGLVLGVDEFEQEQFFFLERDQLHHRALHGYGTVCGLRLSRDELDVTVAAGVAVNPQGKVIRVPRDQCANLSDWLDAGDHRAQLEQCTGATAGPVSLFVRLCHRECEADNVPLPGAPCRTDEETLAASRVIETFELHLDPHPPRADEEEAVRVLGALLREIDIVDVSTPVGPIADLIATVEARVRAVPGLLTPGGWPPDPCSELSPPGSPLGSPLEPEPGSPLGSPLSSPLSSPLGSPLEGGPLTVAREDVAEVLRAALRVWVTEVRPALLEGTNCSACPPDESCVLLGELMFEIRTDGTIDPSTLEIAQDERPILLQSRVLQEWLPGGGGDTILSGPGPGPGPGPAAPVVLAGDASGPAAVTTVGALQGTPVADVAPAVGQVLTGVVDPAAPDGVRWEPRPVTGGPPVPPLAGDVSGDIGDTAIVALQDIRLDAAAPAADQVLTAVDTGAGVIVWRPAAPPAPPTPPVVLGGDVTGNAGTNEVRGLQGVPVDAPPGDVTFGDVLTAVDDGAGNPAWRPAAPPGPGGASPIVAAGRFRSDGTPIFDVGGLRVTQFGQVPILYYVEFSAFSVDRNFVLKGTVLTILTDPPHTLEVISVDADDRVKVLMDNEGFTVDGGLVIRVMTIEGEPSEQGFLLEISRFP